MAYIHEPIPVSNMLNGKGKVVPQHTYGGAGGLYNSDSFMTSALDSGEWSASLPGRTLPPGIGHPVPTVQEAGWDPESVWTQRLEEKFLASAGDRTAITWSSSL
jgi:hypothetical protein